MFTMPQSAFYFAMIDKITYNLIDTGVMKHIVKTVLRDNIKLKNEEESSKIFSMDDLSFGFNIWIGFCVISSLSFVLEILLLRFKIKHMKIFHGKRIKFAKIKPVMKVEFKVNGKLKAKTLNHFRIKKSLKEIDNLNEIVQSDSLNIKEEPENSNIDIEKVVTEVNKDGEV